MQKIINLYHVLKNIVKSFATLGFIGYLPLPGTMGTIVTLPLAYALSYLCLSCQMTIVAYLCFVSFFIIGRVLLNFREKDPQQIILDEVIGCLMTFIGITYSFQVFFIGFILFRILDIFKPLGIKYFEKLPGAFGVIVDDCVAGLCANLILRCFFI